MCLKGVSFIKCLTDLEKETATKGAANQKMEWQKFLAVGEAYKAIFWPNPGFKLNQVKPVLILHEYTHVHNN